MVQSKQSLSVNLVLGVLLSFQIGAQSTIAPATKPTKEDPILKKIESNDPKLQHEAIDEVRKLLSKYPHTIQHDLKFAWMWPLMKAGYFTETEDLAFQAIVAKPQYTQNIVDLQRTRAYCFMKLNRGPEALSQSKAYYNIAKMIKTEDSVNQLAWAFKMARPGDEDIIE